MPYIIDGKKIADLLAGGVNVLDSEYELEDVIASIKDMRNKVKFLEELKRKRAAALKAEVLKLTGHIKILEEVVMNTMEQTSHKSLNFPGVGKISVVSRKGKWVVEDEDELLDYLAEQDETILDKVCVSKNSIVKKELDKILNVWKKTGEEIPNCVSFDPPEKSLKISYDKDVSIEEPDIMEEDEQRKEPVRVDPEDYDNLEI